jgi:hypothetical protein
MSGVQLFWASGPLALLAGQTASASATNPDDSPVPFLIAVLTGNGSAILATTQTVLQPGAGTCVNYTRSNAGPNVYAVVVPNGQLVGNGGIVQIRPGGGGCIGASLQIQPFSVNNVPSQTILYAQILRYEDSMRGKKD